MSKRPSFSVSRAFYERISAHCAERGVSMSALCERVINEAMAVPYVERPRLAALLAEQPAKPTPQPAQPQQPAAPTCPICFRLGHTSEFHNRPATIEVSQGLFELLDDLRIRARELEGRDVTHAELLEQGIERALEAEEVRAMADTTRRDALERSIRYLLPTLTEREIEQMDAELVRILRAREQKGAHR